MKKTIALIILLILALPFYLKAAPPVPEVAYGLEQCIATALEKHPSLRASAGAVKASESRVGQAKAGYYPQLNLSSGYQRIGPTTPHGETRDDFDQYSSSINLGMTLFDFGKTSTQVRIQNLNVNAARADYEDDVAQVILNVKNAYYNLLQTERNRDVAIDTMKQFQQHLDQANAFFRIGTKPKFDVTKAEVDVGNARLNVLKAENAVRVARMTLKDVMGIPENADFPIVDNLAYQKSDLLLNDALNAAYANRPDLQSVRARREAAERLIHLAQKGYYPTLSGSAGYGYSGTDFPLGSGWNAGVALSFPLFSGLSTKYQVEEARANLEILKANEDSIRQAIRLDVEKAYLYVQDTVQQIALSEITVLQARDNYDLASGRYRAGVGSPIEVADATITLNNARANMNTALYNHKIAQAALEKAIGAKP
ncbi:MAG: TolC family protein [Smithella sp.]|nr:TolC family protein [Smithella sp.]MDM7987887.1 TolC family protein [Smithella sp.]HOU50264.1 TolC family protein [Smithella sp.]HQG65227.1 TolC family protein [Smithella sp.]HQH16508.1 TolC family protein [Smithella sp.]